MATHTAEWSFQRVLTRLAQAIGMAAAMAAGIAALLLLPHPHPPVAPKAAPAPAPAAPVMGTPAAIPVSPPPLRPRISPAPTKLKPAAAHRARPAPLPQIVARRTPSPCPTPVTRADRLVCGDPALASQDRRLRAAYRQALAAGADRLAIDRAQARWHGARDRATSAPQLSLLYDRRIAELEAAARRP